MSDPLIGRQVNNFVIRERLGQGGMASVYLAYQPSVNREVALKIITLSTGPSERDEFRLRFAQEAQVIAGLEHAHILPVYDYGIYDNQIAYIAMRLLRGGTLADLLVDEPLDFDRAAEIFSQIALGLSYAHRKGVIHRDLKPSNILFDESGFAYLSDFGLAKMMENSLGLTKSDAIVGTPMYMSPEQLRGTALDIRSDIYSLGCVLYHMLVGHQPFADSATGIVSIIYQQLEKDPTSPRELNPEIPPAVEQVVMKALSKDREARYATAEEMASALNKALGREMRGQLPQRARETTFEKPAAHAAMPPTMTDDDLIVRRVPIETASQPTAQAEPEAHAPQTARNQPSAMRWLIPAAVLVIVVAVALVALNMSGGGGSDPTSTTIVQATQSSVLIGAETVEAPTETTAPTVTNEATPVIEPTAGATTQQALVPAEGAQGQIAFVSNRDGNENIYVINLSDLSVERLTNGPDNDREPSWSPDGSQLVFSSYNAAGSITNYFMDANGSNRQQIDAWAGWDPTWSPDGTQILFGAYGSNSADIFIVNADGSDLRNLTDNDFDEGFASWSQDGTQIVYISRENDQDDLQIMNADGSNVRRLTDDSATDSFPAWSPNGMQIAFQSDREGFSKIYLIDVDGSNLYPLYNEPVDGYEPSWSPDGQQIVFSSYRESSNANLFIVDVDGTNVQQLTSDDGENRLPAWRPDA